MTKFEKFLILFSGKLRNKFKENLDVSLEIQGKNLRMTLMEMKRGESDTSDKPAPRKPESFI